MPHLTEGVFPITRGSTWLGDAAQLPPEIRGDRDELPHAVVPTRRHPEGPCRRAGRACGGVRAAAAGRGTPAAVRRAHPGRAGAAGVRAPLGSQHRETRRSQRIPAGVRRAGRGWAQPDEWATAPDPDDQQSADCGPAERHSWPIDPLGARRQGGASAAPTGCWPRWPAPASTGPAGADLGRGVARGRADAPNRTSSYVDARTRRRVMDSAGDRAHG